MSVHGASPASLRDDAIRDFGHRGLDESDDDEIQARIAEMRAAKLEAARNGDPGALDAARMGDGDEAGKVRETATYVGPLDPITERVREWAEQRKGKHNWLRECERIASRKARIKREEPIVSQPRRDPETILAAGRAIEARGQIVTVAALAAEMGLTPTNAYKHMKQLQGEGNWPFQTLRPGQKTSDVNGHANGTAKPKPEPKPKAEANPSESPNGSELTPKLTPAPPPLGSSPDPGDVDPLDVARQVGAVLRQIPIPGRLRVLDLLRDLLSEALV